MTAEALSVLVFPFFSPSVFFNYSSVSEFEPLAQNRSFLKCTNYLDQSKTGV